MKTFLITLCMFFSISMFSQNYHTGIGVRGGFGYGVTVKHFVGPSSALEGIVSNRWGGLLVTGLYEKHANAFDVRGLNWFYGAGGHIGFWNGKYDNHPWFDDNEPYTVIGLDGIIGIEYDIQEIPFSVGVDWKPAINLVGYSGFLGNSGALSVRYLIR